MWHVYRMIQAAAFTRSSLAEVSSLLRHQAVQVAHAHRFCTTIHEGGASSDVRPDGGTTTVDSRVDFAWLWYRQARRDEHQGVCRVDQREKSALKPDPPQSNLT